MKPNIRYQLLCEIAGQNTSSYVRNMKTDFKETQSYKILSYNMEDVKKHGSGKAKAIVYSYEHINLNPKSVQDYFIMQTALDYLALHSYPEYYLNPLAIDPNYQGEINSIGDLYIDYQGKDRRINDIILDETDSAATKKKEINSYLEYYLSDMNHIIDESMESVSANAIKSQNDTKETISSVSENIFFVLVNVLLLILVTINLNDVRSYFLHLDYLRATTYVIIAYPLTTLVYDICFSLYHSYKAKIEEPYRYAKRFLGKNSAQVYQDVRNEKERLYDYISGAINHRIVLRDDIRDFSKLSSSFIDFKAVLDVEKHKKSKLFRVFRNFNYSTRILEVVVLIFSLIVLVLDVVFRSII